MDLILFEDTDAPTCLNIQGWEISGSGKSAPELRLEYLLLKQKAQSEKQLQLTQPNSEFSVGVDLTDLFDRYLQEPAHERTVLPKPYINQLQLAQSVTAGITLSNAISLAGQLTARNGLGVGSGMFMWRHYCGKKSLLSFTTIDTELSYGRAGRGPGLAVRLRRPFGDRLVGSFGFSLNSVAIHSRGSHIAVVPALSTGVQFQLLPRTQIRFEWRWFLDAGLSSELVWSSPNDQYAVRLSVRLSAAGLSGVAVRVEKAVSWPWLNPPRGSGVEKKESDTRRPDWVKADEDELELQRGSQGRFFGSVDVNTTDVVEVTMGAQCSLSVYSRLSGSFSFSLRRGVNVRLALQRGTQTYSVPIILSEQPSKVAAGYGFVVPILLFAAIRTLVYEPYLNKQLERAQMVRRNKLKGELARRRREALSTQSLMQQSASRIRNAESHIGGLIIVRAVYGCLPASGDSPTIPDVAGPLTLDVTVPIQALVNTSRLRLPPGRWSDIQGFYDPCMGLVRSPVKACALRRLRVTYTFRGTLHEVTVTENQGLAIPMAKHRTDET
ncbi:unnamed protein product [Dicrocoelium dendriticum]|nr:unnamed protein product [Dicrocoelium dendriticum]